MPNPIFSVVIPCRDLNDPKLSDLIASIKAQDFPQDQIEILTITEGDSESAKGIGIKRAKGEIIGMFCADNFIVDRGLFKTVEYILNHNTNLSAVYPCKYAHIKDDNSLNRYFSLIGGNDPICYYLGKNDRWPHEESLRIKSSYQPSYGCNGFFYKAEDIKQTNLDNYYPMDNASEVHGKIATLGIAAIWHRTSDSLISFLIKRYKYAKDLYCDRDNRRWRMLDTREDYWRLLGFIISTLTVIPCLWISFKGFRKIRDFAWFWHLPVCIGFLITYSILTVRTFLHRLLSQRLDVVTALKSALSPLPNKLTQTTKSS